MLIAHRPIRCGHCRYLFMSVNSFSFTSDSPVFIIKFGEVEGELESQEPCVGKLFSVPALKTAGIAAENGTKILYCREASAEHWNVLCGLKAGNMIRVSGPPGVGKSTLTWAWAIWEWKTMKKSVFWMQLSKGFRFETVYLIHNEKGP
mmetsp:Transcript_24944/g.34821  ORF Transcript_24944/g.34821 Transcript_24944/m.34821 type:complete len:148 (-) Transcript_24944:532-975(-)